MEKQRELIQQLEQQQHETEQRLEACPKDDEEDMLEQHQQQMDSIEHQHKIFDDMEFKQLEVVLLCSDFVQRKQGSRNIANVKLQSCLFCQ